MPSPHNPALSRLRRAVSGAWFDAASRRVALLLLSLLLVELLTRLVVVATLPLGQGRFYLGELVLIGRAEHEVGQQWLLLIGNMGFALLFFVLRVASRIPLMNYPFILGSAGSFGNLVEVNLRGAATDWIAIFPKVLPVAYNLGDFLIFAAIAWGAVNYVRLLLLAHRTGKLVADESSSV